MKTFTVLAVEISCDLPLVSENIALTPTKDQYLKGEAITAECTNGLNGGSTQLTCDATGHWSGSYPTCYGNFKHQLCHFVNADSLSKTKPLHFPILKGSKHTIKLTVI